MQEVELLIREYLKETADYMGYSFEKEKFSLSNIESNIVGSETFYSLQDEFESDFFWNLFSHNLPVSYYHYTSFNSIFQILKSRKIQLSPLIGLNDRYEVDLVNQKMGIDSGHLMKTLNGNMYYIMSFSKKNDELNQWRLYGDDGEGVMLEFRLKNINKPSKRFFISSVSYDLGIFDIYIKYREIIKEKYQANLVVKNINYWKHFFKPKDYIYEDELRFLVNNGDNIQTKNNEKLFKINRYNILVPYIELDLSKEEGEGIFPFELRTITLGPKMKEKEINKIQLENYWLDKYPGDPRVYKVNQSKILHYR